MSMPLESQMSSPIVAFADAGEAALFDALSPMLDALGLRLVDLEVHRQKQKRLVLFIDLKDSNSEQVISVEDCARASRALDEPLDKLPEIERVFGEAPYELEVSSPGLDRPLKRLSDFTQFSGRIVRIGTFRPLSAEELENPVHAERNPRQKVFLGVLKGVLSEPLKVELDLSVVDGAPRPKKKSASPVISERQTLVRVPFELICKAQLEPDFGDVFKNSNETKARQA